MSLDNPLYEYAENNEEQCFGSFADHVELLNFHEMKLSKWQVENGQIKLDGWFLASFKLQQGDAEAVKNRTGSISEESKGFDYSVTLGTDFKLVKG